MGWNQASAGVYVAASWVTRALTLHLSWLALVLAGGFVLGVFPATFALFVAAKRELNGELGNWPLAAMWRDFRRCFWRSNAFGYATSLLGAAGLLDLVVLHGEHDPVAEVIRVVVIATTILLAIWLPNAWIALAHSETINLRAVRMSALAVIMSPLRAALVAGSAAAIIVVCFFVPAGALLAGSSILALPITRLGKGMH
jgi:uncharacterized membrane protein YesL